jgi:hypothetical protein
VSGGAAQLVLGEIEFGFMHPVPATEPRVPPDWQDRTVPGLPIERLWYCRLTVVFPDTHSREHYVLSADAESQPQPIWPACVAAIQAASPSASASWVLDNDEGRAVISTDTCAEDAAFAMAVCKRESWDESDPIEIVCNDKTFAVSLSVLDKRVRGFVRAL